MIITYLYGGLGNQMFQYAIARKLSIKHRTELKLNADWFKTEIKGTTVREYELNHFKLNAEFDNAVIFPCMEVTIAIFAYRHIEINQEFTLAHVTIITLLHFLLLLTPQKRDDYQ